MSNHIIIFLDTTAPANPSIKINSGSVFTSEQLVMANISSSDSDKQGYQMLIWGDVDETHNASIKSTEGTSSWISYKADQQLKLSTGDGLKTLNVKIRDDVHNESSIATSTITLDSSNPTVSTTEPDVSRISKVAGKDTFTFTFNANKDFTEYKVKLVTSINATEDTGDVIPTHGGSINTSGTGEFSTGQVITVTIKGVDLESAGATADGQHIVKVFVKDQFDNWSL